MRVLQIARPVRVRHQRIETEHQSRAKNGHGIIKDASQAHRSNGNRAICLPANHHGVHDTHRHPAEFCEHQRERKLQHGPRFFGDVMRKQALEHQPVSFRKSRFAH